MGSPADPDPYLRAYQAAFRPELAAAVRSYQLPDAARVLDCPCGDGFYAGLFAGHLRAGTDAEQLVTEIYTLNMGMLHDARFLRDPRAAERAQATWDRLISTYQS